MLHDLCAQSEYIERTDQIDSHYAGKPIKRHRPVSSHGATGSTNSCTVDIDMDGAKKFFCSGNSSSHCLIICNVTCGPARLTTKFFRGLLNTRLIMFKQLDVGSFADKLPGF